LKSERVGKVFYDEMKPIAHTIVNVVNELVDNGDIVKATELIGDELRDLIEKMG